MQAHNRPVQPTAPTTSNPAADANATQTHTDTKARPVAESQQAAGRDVVLPGDAGAGAAATGVRTPEPGVDRAVHRPQPSEATVTPPPPGRRS